MNNSQVAVLAASMRTGTRTMTSVQDMLEDSKVIETYLDEQDSIKDRQSAMATALAAYTEAEQEPLPSWLAFKATQMPTADVEQTAADENEPGSFEALVPPALRGAH